MTYPEKLSDPRWQRKRLEIFNRDNFTCLKCGNATNELHVHHKYYNPGKHPWEYNDDCFETVCYICHSKEHGKPIETEITRKPIIVSSEELERRERGRKFMQQLREKHKGGN